MSCKVRDRKVLGIGILGLMVVTLVLAFSPFLVGKANAAEASGGVEYYVDFYIDELRDSRWWHMDGGEIRVDGTVIGRRLRLAIGQHTIQVDPPQNYEFVRWHTGTTPGGWQPIAISDRYANPTTVTVTGNHYLTALVRRVEGPRPQPEPSIVYRGVTTKLWNLKAADFQRIAGWNMNSVMFEIWWSGRNTRSLEPSGIEPNIRSARVYNTALLNRLRQAVDLAKRYGLKPFIGIRITYDSDLAARTDAWPYTWATFNYVFYNSRTCIGQTGLQPGLERFLSMLDMMGQRFPDCGFCPVFFPFHREPASSEAVSRYYAALPQMVNTLRNRIGNNPIYISPKHQGSANGLNSGEYNQARIETLYHSLSGDPNLIWGTNSHDGSNYNAVVQCGEWNMNYAELDANYDPLRNFKARHPEAHIGCCEFSNLAIHTCTRACSYISSSRLAWARRNCEIMDELAASWWYYSYRPTEEWATPQCSGQDSQLTDILSGSVRT